MKRSKSVKLVIMGLAPIALTACNDDSPRYEYMTLNECIDYVRAIENDDEFDLDVLIGPGYSSSNINRSYYKYRQKHERKNSSTTQRRPVVSSYSTSSSKSTSSSSTSSKKTTTSSRSGFGSSASARGSWGRSSWGG